MQFVNRTQLTNFSKLFASSHWELAVMVDCLTVFLPTEKYISANGTDQNSLISHNMVLTRHINFAFYIVLPKLTS